MFTPQNPLAGTSLQELWYLKRKSPGGKVAHLIDPVTLQALCPAPHCRWLYVDEQKPINTCVKCAGIAAQASLVQEKDSDRLREC